MLDNKTFVKRYRQFAAIDKKKAKKRFFDIHDSRPTSAVGHTVVWLKRAASVAAVAAICLVCWHYTKEDTSTTTPQIDEKSIVAMEKLEKSGINEATLLIRGAKASTVSSAIAATEIMLNNKNAVKDDHLHIYL